MRINSVVLVTAGHIVGLANELKAIFVRSNNDNAMNTQANFTKVQNAINARRHMLGETVWNHIGTERRNMITVEECARENVNMYLFIKWTSSSRAK